MLQVYYIVLEEMLHFFAPCIRNHVFVLEKYNIREYFRIVKLYKIIFEGII